MNIALIIAGGSGVRMNQEIPKQFITVYDRPIIVHTLEAFQKHANIDVIAVVCLTGWENVLQAYAKQFGITKLKHLAPGGVNGQDSIRNGLFELAKHYGDDDIVLVHDSIRPLVSQDIISDAIVTAEKKGCAIPIIPCAEAILTTEDGIVSTGSVPRESLKRTQTPQAFRLGKLVESHKQALEAGITNSVASCTLMIELGEQVYFSLGSEKNIKITTLEDLEISKALLGLKKNAIN